MSARLFNRERAEQLARDAGDVTLPAIAALCVVAGVALFAIVLVLLTGPAKGAEIRARSGATARVADSAAPKFQALIDWLDAHGYPIKVMGGIRRGKCWTGGMHPCGLAIDINQTARSIVTHRFPAGTEAFARSLGLVPGSSWCNRDTGHFQVGGHDGCRRRYAEHPRQVEATP